MKGISTIIASIILVVITIGLIAVAYLYMSGLITGTTAHNIELMDAYCDYDPVGYNITTIVRNIGTASITSGLNFIVDGKTGVLGNTTCDDNIKPGDTITCVIYKTTNENITKGMHQLRIISSASVGGPVSCL